MTRRIKPEPDIDFSTLPDFSLDLPPELVTSTERFKKRYLIRRCYQYSLTRLETEAKVNSLYGRGYLNATLIYKWFNRFRSGRLSLEENYRSGARRRLPYEEVERFFTLNPTAIPVEAAKLFNISHTHVQRILHELGFEKRFDSWIKKDGDGPVVR